jgi:hypothetical protein
MLYKFDRKALVYRKVKWFNAIYYLMGAGMGAALVVFFLSINISAKTDSKTTEDKIMVILAERNHFTCEKLISKIKEMHFMYPYIIYGQALLETDHFRSRIFRENNNIFGMKEATKRVNVSLGTQYEHAFYNNWMDSVYDYGLYYATYLSRLTTEDEYFNYLSDFYAEDTSYVEKLKEIIVREKLKSLFN